ncbi:hypothetical protein MMC07_004186 [Pseudocyphellaria aurata]|nr:hypothetical protein [Pseudocyphellaria aurata]
MEILTDSLLEVLEFENSIWSNGLVSDDPFYTVPGEVAEVTPGTLLKLEKDVDTTKYTLPPATALSRIMHQSENINGARVPTAAYVLWPYSPRSQPDGYPIVAWAHGTSGLTANSAPSHHKNLWQHFFGPYQLALQGYVVVATDYAGLGVDRHASGEKIVHQYLACPSHANDVVYSVEAAQAAFPELSKEFVVIGHSQGGGAAWATAQRQVAQPVSGYLGAVAVSPVSNLLEEPGPLLPIIIAAMCPGLASAYPDFKLSNMLTANGEKRLEALLQSEAGVASCIALMSEGEILQSNWRQDSHFQKYHSLVSNGGKKIGGPLLVIHGDSDPRVSSEVTANAVNNTADSFPSSQLEYVLLPHITHTPALTASQRLWMEWIADRFAGRVVKSHCQRSTLPHARPGASYQDEQNWYLQSAKHLYQAP